jgi:hypothetical protein
MSQTQARSLMQQYAGMSPEEQAEFRGMLQGYQMAEELRATPKTARQAKNKMEEATAATAVAGN